MKDFKIFNITGTIEDNMEREFNRFLESVVFSPETPVLITINSTGGCVRNAISMYNKLRSIDNPVYTLITRDCMSSATVIALAAPFSRRFAFKNSQFMLHAIRLKFKPDSFFTVKDIEDMLTDTSHETEIYKAIYRENIYMSEELLDRYMSSNDELHILDNKFEELQIANVISKFSDIS